MKKIIVIICCIFLLMGCGTNDYTEEDAVDTFFNKYRQKDDNTVHAVVRYVEHSSIKEVTLYIADPKKDIYSIDVSEDSTSIAVFKQEGENKRLVRFYDVEEHMTETEEFMDLAYNRKFPTKKVTDQLILKK